MEEAFVRSSAFSCPATIQDFEQFKNHVRSMIPDFLGQYPFEHSPDLNPQIVEEVDEGEYVRRKIRYGNETDDVVFAYLLIPKTPTNSRAAILCLPGSYMTDNIGKEVATGLAHCDLDCPDDPKAYSRDLTLAGYVTLTPDYPCAGERTAPGLKSHDTSVFDKRFPRWTRVGMSSWDISRAIDFLQTLPDVDSERIGCTGLSQGGQMTVLGAALDERIKAAVSVCGWSPFRGKDITPLMATYNFPHLRDYVEQNRTLPFDMDHIAAMIAPRPFLDISGSRDRYFPNQSQLAEAEQNTKRVYQLLKAEDCFEAVSFDMDHRYSHDCAKLTLDWFNRHL